MTGRTIDPAEALAMLKKHQPNFERMQAAEDAKVSKWQNEIAMLERRVTDLYEDVDLGNGDKIAVRTALSEEEIEEYNNLEKKKSQIDRDDPEQNEIAYRQLEILTANPLLTARWFRENRDKWPVNDTLMIVAGFAENNQRISQDRVQNLRKFRSQ